MRRKDDARVEGRCVRSHRARFQSSRTLHPASVWVEAPALIYWAGAILGVLCAAAALLAFGTLL